MRPLAGSDVLADAVVIPPRPLIPHINIRRLVRLEKSTETSNRKKHLLVSKKEM